MSAPTWATRLPLDGGDWLFAFRDPPKDKKEEGEVIVPEIPTDLKWLPARVPGNVQLDLHANKKIPDPYFDTQISQSTWIEKKEWYYKKEFTLNLKLRQCAQLIFQGIDYIADLWINGHYAGRHTGMFSHWVINITQWAEKGKNTIVVRLAPPKTYAKSRFKEPRMQMNYGWDIAPRCITAGIWDSVEVKVFFRICLVHNSFIIKFETEDKGEEGTIPIVVEGKVADPERLLDVQKSAIIKVEIKGKNFQSEPLNLDLEVDRQGGFTIRALIENPKYWTSWDRGTPNLYTARMTLILENRECDREETTFGIREITLNLNTSWQEKDLPWTYSINGVPTYIRGANWVPADMFPGKVTRDTYAKYLTRAKELGINMLRVWGGGLREKSAFYEIANELGIMIWQEFPVACVTFPFLPKTTHFLKVLGQEAISIVETLRNHPCLIQWCGGNEVSVEDNPHVFRMLKQIVEEYDGTRSWLDVSPMEGQGERHNYEVWHGYAPYSAYFDDDNAFVSEFGMCAFPVIESLKEFLPAKALKEIFSRNLRFHNPQMIPLYGFTTRHKRYALPYLTHLPPTLEEFTIASQKNQARALQTAIEHYRCSRPENSGCMFWQLDESWPGIGFGPIDYYFREKLAYATIKRSFQPLLIASKTLLLRPVRLGKEIPLDLTIVNDWNRSFQNVTIAARIGTHELLKHTGITIPENVIIRNPPESVKIPAGSPRDHLVIEIWGEKGELLASNDYDLAYRDTFNFVLVRKLVGQMQRITTHMNLKLDRPFSHTLIVGVILSFCIILANFYVYFKWLWIVRLKRVREFLTRVHHQLRNKVRKTSG